LTVPLYNFDEFELDGWRFELRRKGRPLKLERIPLELLILLVEQDGKLVARQEIIERLWGKDVFVDTEHGINTAVRKIRSALGDDAERPRFVQTVPGKGYRFIATIGGNGNGADPAVVAKSSAVAEPLVPASKSLPLPNPEKHLVGTSRPWAKTVAWSVAGVLLLIAGLVYFYFKLAPSRLASKPLPAVPFTALPGMEVAPTFSPDGSQIAFAWNGDPASGSKGYDLYIKVSGSEKLLRLTNHPSAVISPAWSPNGEQIAFHRVAGSETGIYVVPALGGPERKLVSTHAANNGAGISWSPDSKWIAFSDSTAKGEHHRLSLLAVSSLEITPIPHGEKCQEEISPAFSRGGGQLAYVCSLGSGGFGLYTVALPRGIPHQLGLYAGWPNGIAWTSDDNRLVGSRHVEGTEHDELYEVSLANGQLRALPFGESGEYPTISAKGDKLAYQAAHYAGVNIYRRDLLHPAREAVRVIASTRDSWYPRYSPDGKHIAFISNRSGNPEIWMSNSDGTGMVKVSNFNNPQTGTLSWSPDSQKIAFDSLHNGHQAVYIVDTADLVAHQFSTNVPEPSQPNWSHDGKWIYFIAGGSPGRIYRCPAEGGNAVAISSEAGFFPQGSFDGEKVYFAVFSAGRAVLKIISLRHPGTQSVVEGMPNILLTNLVVGQDGIFFLSEDDVTLSYFDFASKHVKQLLRMKEPGNVALAVSPDKHWVLFAKVEQEDRDIMLVGHYR
jgi:Tol biopolymer transport system component/DNA-binding winged helix-turn-helix (wHTH) protein